MRALLVFSLLAAGCTGAVDDTGKPGDDTADTDTGDTDDTDTGDTDSGDTDSGDTDSGDTGDTGDTGETAPPPDLLPADFPESVTEDGGCGDVYIYARDASDTVMVDFAAWDLGIAATACLEGPQSVVISLPDAAVTMTAVLGEHVSAFACSDVIVEEPVVIRKWTATAGTLTLDVTPLEGANCEEEWSRYGNATLTLDDVVFTPDDGGEGEVTVDTATWQAFVGWMPG